MTMLRRRTRPGFRNGNEPHWKQARLRDVAIPLLGMIGGLDAILVISYALNPSVAALFLALGVTIGFPWLLLAVPRGWRGTWSLSMVIEGPDSLGEGPILWEALCDGLRSQSILLEEIVPLATSGRANRFEASAYTRPYRTRVRLVNQLAGAGTKTPVLFSDIVLAPDSKKDALEALRAVLTEVLSRERTRYREEAFRKGYLPRTGGAASQERLN